MIKYLNIIVILAVLAPITASADTATLNPTDDAVVVYGYPGTNYGSDDSINVGYHSSFGWANTMIKFDLSPYTGATVNSADLRLYVYELIGGIPASEIHNGSNDADWNEGTVTWNNKPGIAGYAFISAPSVIGWWVTDVTSWIQDIVDGTEPNNGFQIFKNDMEWGTFHMRSKEYSNSSFHPELEFNYTPVSIESASLGQVKAAFK